MSEVGLVANVQETNKGKDFVVDVVAIVDPEMLEELESLHGEEVKDANSKSELISSRIGKREVLGVAGGALHIPTEIQPQKGEASSAVLENKKEQARKRKKGEYDMVEEIACIKGQAPDRNTSKN